MIEQRERATIGESMWPRAESGVVRDDSPRCCRGNVALATWRRRAAARGADSRVIEASQASIAGGGFETRAALRRAAGWPRTVTAAAPDTSSGLGPARPPRTRARTLPAATTRPEPHRGRGGPRQAIRHDCFSAPDSAPGTAPGGGPASGRSPPPAGRAGAAKLDGSRSSSMRGRARRPADDAVPRTSLRIRHAG